MSNLLRGQTFAILDHSALDTPIVLPRIFGTRVIRAGTVGLQVPMSLPVPSAVPAVEIQAGPLAADVPVGPTLSAVDIARIEEAARAQGYADGFEQGRAAGMASAEAAMDESVQRLMVLATIVQESHAGFFRAAEREVVDLALHIAQKVVEREVENIPDLAVNVIRAALEEMDARTAVRVRVSPDDETLLRRRWAQVVPPGIGADRIELQQDERVHSGGAVIETSHGEVDAQLESKLAQLGNALWTFVMDVNSAQDQQGEADA